MRFSIFAICLWAISGPLLAQDIRWQPETFTPGDFVTIDQTPGGLIHHVFAGRSGNGYLVQSFRGARPGENLVFSTYLDANGNYLRWVRPDGVEIRYVPHDCTRELGRCQYTEIHSDGTQQVRLRITEATRNGLRFDEYNQAGEHIFSGQFDLDARGNGGSGRVRGDRGVTQHRLVQSVYQ